MRKELIKLRKIMERENIDAYIIPSSDPHQGEYVADYYQGRKWLSGFTGSAGVSVILRDKAGLWTDGRYHIQAEGQLKDSGIDLFKAGKEGVLTKEEWLSIELPKGAKIGFDGRVISQKEFLSLDEKLDSPNYAINSDLLEKIWEERLPLSKEKVFDYSIEYVGQSRKDKIQEVVEELEKKKADLYVLSSLDDIAWLLNLRGTDISYTPLFYSYAVVERGITTLFIDGDKIDRELVAILEKDGVRVEEYMNFGRWLEESITNKTSICDPSRTSRYTYSILEKGTIIDQVDITTIKKAVKNEVERNHTRNAYRKDCVALAKFFNHVETNIDLGITELESEGVLEEYRKEDETFIYNSFAPIAGYKDHAAMMHFKSNKENTYKLEKNGLFLVDSGGQYTDGTTDITRTLVLGTLTEEEKIDFTLALQGVIDLSTTKFLKGTTGYALDAICRRPMWNHGLDYKCGTGHGIGFFLNIHEGPCGFGPRKSYDTVLEEGMLITVEPGVYKEDRHGIRHENSIFVRKYSETEFGEFYELETITFFPIDTRAIITSILTPFQLNWLNEYHQKTFELLSPSLNGTDLEWLKERTKAI